MDRQHVRVILSYCRLFIASCLFMAGLALQFVPSPAQVARETRTRERLLKAVPVEQHAEWIEKRDLDEGYRQGYLRLGSVLLGGLGLAAALRELAYLVGRYNR